MAVIDCLEDPDDALRLKTLALLAVMTKANNVAAVVGRLMEFLRGCSDEHVRRDIATKVRGRQGRLQGRISGCGKSGGAQSCDRREASVSRARTLLKPS